MESGYMCQTFDSKVSCLWKENSSQPGRNMAERNTVGPSCVESPEQFPPGLHLRVPLSKGATKFEDLLPPTRDGGGGFFLLLLISGLHHFPVCLLSSSLPGLTSSLCYISSALQHLERLLFP